MNPERQTSAWSALAWLVFPLVPALLGTLYHDTINFSFGHGHGPDPRDWDWPKWVYLLGPLLGYGFLAGATLRLPVDPGPRGWKRWLDRRSTWFGIGPWIGFLGWSAFVASVVGVLWALHRVYPPSGEWGSPIPADWYQTWVGWLVNWALVCAGIATLSYGWLGLAWVAIRRARRIGDARRALERGLAVAIGFVGSLIGTFWAITAVWRSFFFDPRIVPILLAAASTALLSGCGSTISYGEVRRRDLFQAMLMAWLLGLALIWRWWSRPRSGPPGGSGQAGKS